MVVGELIAELDRVAEMRVRLTERALHRKTLERQAREDPHGERDEQHEVREIREKLHARRHGDDEQDEPQERETPGLHEIRRGALARTSTPPAPTPGSRPRPSSPRGP